MVVALQMRQAGCTNKATKVVHEGRGAAFAGPAIHAEVQILLGRHIAVSHSASRIDWA
jgi:hypothetical protein